MKTWFLGLFFAPLALSAQILLPGDANNDGRVDHRDVLAIGLSYGQEGPPREPPFQGINWSPKQFLLWPGGLPSTNINFGFSDCDGNGLVNEADMAALKLNYDSLQQISVPPPKPYLPPDTFFTTARPRILLRFDQDTATVKDTLTLRILYEQPPGLPPALSPLGVAFTLEFDEHLVKDSLTRIFFEPTADDLLFAAAATGFADARAVPPGMVEFGAAGKASPALNVPRPLGVVRFIVEDVIVRQDTFWTAFKIDVAKPLMINAMEQVMLFDIVADDVVLYQQLESSAGTLARLPVRAYPSPLRDVLYLESPEAPLQQVTVFDALGHIVTTQEAGMQRQLALPAHHWPQGMLWVKMAALDGRVATVKVWKTLE